MIKTITDEIILKKISGETSLCECIHFYPIFGSGVVTQTSMFPGIHECRDRCCKPARLPSEIKRLYAVDTKNYSC